MDLPPSPRPWDTDASALADAVTAGNGYVVIAVKEPGSSHALQTGIRAAVSAAAVTKAADLLRGLGVPDIDILENIGAIRARIDPATAIMLRANPLVDFIEPRRYGELQAQTVPWGISMVRAPDAWTITSGTGAKIDIIDTGHQQGHSDLPFVSTANCAGAYGGCDDGGIWHGTHVLGIATARNNSIGVVGVAPGINASDVYTYGACSSVSNSCPTDEVTAGINSGIWNVDVISMSLSQPYDAAQASAVAQAWNNGIVLVAAAGNNGGNTEIYPARYTNVIGVSGVNENKTFANPAPCGSSSNWGNHVDLAAPFTAYSTIGGNSYGTLCGTSMATPHVAGAAALVIARNPSWTNQQVVNQLFATAEDRGTVGKDVYFGYGIVDAAAAVGYITPPPFSVSLSGPTYAYDQYVTITAAVNQAGSYYYVWDYRWCRNGSAPGDCDQLWHPRAEGQNLTSVQNYISHADYWVDFRVSVKDYQGGPTRASDSHRVDGAGEGSSGGGGCEPGDLCGGP
jgi:subtilisin family serine protease